MGTPGFPREVFVVSNVGWGEVVFSEIMFATNRLSYEEPQWIELYNISKTKVVNLEGWRLQINTYVREGETHNQFSSIVLNEIEIRSNQTILLVTGKSRHSDNIFDRQVYDLSEHHAIELGLDTYPFMIFTSKGFSLELKSPDNTTVDKAGNMDGQHGIDEPFFEFAYGGRNRDNERVS